MQIKIAQAEIFKEKDQNLSRSLLINIKYIRKIFRW